MIILKFSGPRGGLRLILNAETYDALSSWDMSAGFLVGISHPNETKEVLKDLALQVSTGAQTYMGIRVSEVRFNNFYHKSRYIFSLTLIFFTSEIH